MYKFITTTLVSLLMLCTSIAHAGWYFTIAPPNGGPPLMIGPYKNYGRAADTLGSALYSHPFACHLHWSANNCRVTGNGFAYPADFPFPTSADDQIPSSAPVKASGGSYDLPRGWYFLFYTATGGSVQKCSDLKQFQALAEVVPGDEIPEYQDMQCPGAPCFSVGFDTACN